MKRIVIRRRFSSRKNEERGLLLCEKHHVAVAMNGVPVFDGFFLVCFKEKNTIATAKAFCVVIFYSNFEVVQNSLGVVEFEDGIL